MIYGLIGLVVIPPVVGSFVFIKETVAVEIAQCEAVRSRRGLSATNVTLASGEKLELWPVWLGGPDGDLAAKKLCDDKRATVTLRGARIKEAPFLKRVISDVE